MAYEEQRRDVVEYYDFLFFACNDVFCDPLQYVSTKNNELLPFYRVKSVNKPGKNPRKHFAQVYTSSNDVIVRVYCNNVRLSTNENRNEVSLYKYS